MFVSDLGTHSTFLSSKRPDAVGNTAYLQVVSRIIGAKAEYPTDAMLVHLLEVQQIAHSISITFADGSNSLMRPQLSALNRYWVGPGLIHNV